MAMAIVVVETTAMAMAKAFCVANAIQQKTLHLSVVQGAVQPTRIKYSKRFLNRVLPHRILSVILRGMRCEGRPAAQLCGPIQQWW